MPHKVWLDDKTYELIPRVSDLVGVYVCQMTAVLNPIHSKKGVDRVQSNIYALKGTIVHHRIENEIRKDLGLRPVALELNEADKRLYKYITKNKSMLREFEEYIELALLNFYSFMDDYGVKPIAPEETLVYIHREGGKIDVFKSLKGTIDLIGEVETENGMETVLIDWKTSADYKEEYRIQLMGYDWLFYKTGKYEEMKRNGQIKYPMSKWNYINGRYDVHRALLVNLGGGSSYKAKWVDVEDKTDFFRCQEAFRKPVETFKGIKRSNGRHIALKLHCLVCSYRVICPFFSEGKIDDGGEYKYEL